MPYTTLSMSTINNRLFEMRKHLNITQKEFGDVGEVSQSTQNRYEQSGTDVPISYLEKIYSKFGHHFNEHWFYFGRGPMFSDSAAPSTVTNQKPEAESGSNHLSPKEAQIVDEVGQFSDFLKKRSLRPEVKRHLLQLLIESIDQTLYELRDDDDDHSETS